MILTTPKNQVIQRKKSRKLNKKNNNQCQQVLKLSGSQGSLKNRSSLRRVRERLKWLLLMFVILSTLMIPRHKLHHRMIYLKLSNHPLRY